MMKRLGNQGVSIVLGLSLMAVAGCKTLNGEAKGWGNGRDPFNFDGLPDREYLVGGGYVIRYRADAEGDLFIADENSSRLLATVTLLEGEKYEMIYDVNDEKLDDNLRALGIDPKTAVFKLYFVPR